MKFAKFLRTPIFTEYNRWNFHGKYPQINEADKLHQQVVYMVLSKNGFWSVNYALVALQEKPKFIIFID